MSNKTIIISLLGVVVIGGALYFAMSKRAGDASSLTNTQEVQAEQITMEPTKDASSDAIVDYLVDGQSGEETKAAEATLEATNSQVEVNTTINGNY